MAVASTQEITQPDLVRQGLWVVLEQGVSFLNPEARPSPSIEFYNLATGRTTRIATIEGTFWERPEPLRHGLWALDTLRAGGPDGE